MATISAADVKELRTRTGAGMMECKKALSEADGNMEVAGDLLRKKGIAKAAKKSDRETTEGAIGSYIHGTGKVGVMVEISCETDFVSKNDEFQALVRDIAMHIAGASPVPQVVSVDDVPEALLVKEREIIAGQSDMAGKPDNVKEKIIDGRIKKFVAEISLLEQAYVKNPDITVGEVMQQAIVKMGENMSIQRFTRFQLGG